MKLWTYDQQISAICIWTEVAPPTPLPEEPGTPGIMRTSSISSLGAPGTPEAAKNWLEFQFLLIYFDV